MWFQSSFIVELAKSRLVGSKEKDAETGLGDFGVRKYSYAQGRFTSIDPLWEEYYSWTPYHYCRNNPVMAEDAGGMWVKEVGAEWHIPLSRMFTPEIEKNSNGYLAERLNKVFYDKWVITAPKIAEFVRTKDIYTLQTSLPENNPANADFKGDIIRFDLSQSENLESEAIHEITHLMGSTEFQAYSAQYASGTLSRKSIENGLTNPDNKDFNNHFRKGMPKEIRAKYFDGSGYLLKDDKLRDEFFNILKTEGDKWIK